MQCDDLACNEGDIAEPLVVGTSASSSGQPSTLLLQNRSDREAGAMNDGICVEHEGGSGANTTRSRKRKDNSANDHGQAVRKKPSKERDRKPRSS